MTAPNQPAIIVTCQPCYISVIKAPVRADNAGFRGCQLRHHGNRSEAAPVQFTFVEVRAGHGVGAFGHGVGRSASVELPMS